MYACMYIDSIDQKCSQNIMGVKWFSEEKWNILKSLQLTPPSTAIAIFIILDESGTRALPTFGTK